MIQANELRIGDWVNGASRGLPEKVTAALLNGIEKGNVVVIPIPLTPEILENLPLFKSNKRNGYPYRFLDGFLKMRNGVFFFKYHNIEIELPYVHIFQNLHFALTGEELQIDL